MVVPVGQAALTADPAADAFADSAAAHPSQSGEGLAVVPAVPVDTGVPEKEEFSEMDKSRGRQSTLTEETVRARTRQWPRAKILVYKEFLVNLTI